MKKFFLIFGLLLSVVSFGTAQNVNKARIEQKISQAAAKIRTMQADFVQTKYLKILNEKMVSKGKLYYQQSDKLRWEYTYPYSYVFIMNGNQVAIRMESHNSIIDVRKNKMFKEIARIMMNSVVGKSLSNNNDFKVSLSDTGNSWIATLIPQRKNMQDLFQKIILNFNKQEAMISRIDIYERKGDKTFINLRNIKINENVSASNFAIH